MNTFRTRFQRHWPRVRTWGLVATAAVTASAGLIMVALARRTLAAPSLAVPFAMSGAALVLASILMFLEVRTDLIELILGGLAGGSFGVTLAEMSAQALTVEDHYKSLWVPVFIAGLLVSFLLFRRVEEG